MHNPSNAGCPRNADPRNETCSCVGLTPEDMEKAFYVISQPEFWCRAKLFHALEAARKKGVLHECLDEIEIPAESVESIVLHVAYYWEKDVNPSEKQAMRDEIANNHYDWLRPRLAAFFAACGVKSLYYEPIQGLLSAHGDKGYSYRGEWHDAGLHFFHGMAMYLLTYLPPFDKEVRETSKGWVAPNAWVIANKHRFLPHLPPVENGWWKKKP